MRDRDKFFIGFIFGIIVIGILYLIAIKMAVFNFERTFVFYIMFC